jgi:Asp-tRNA(Asn)/Glu-tRNA(Gln) amidotransferase A subunit family amidase
MVATQGLVSRSGIVPRGATQDRAGPMGRNVYDITVMLTAIAGWDAEDLMTSRGVGHLPTTQWPAIVAASNLKGRRIGVLREMVGQGPEHAEGVAILERAIEDMRTAGAYVVDPVLTGVDLKTQATSAVGRTAEYEKLHIQNAYLAHLGAAAPFASIQEMIEQVGRVKFAPAMIAALTLPAPAESEDYLARQRSRVMLNALINDTMERFDLDAVVLPFSTTPPPAVDGRGFGGGNALSSNNNLPAVIVPGGYTKDNLPIGIQFIGRNFDDLTLLQVAYGYEQASLRRKPPAIAPALPGERFEY